MTAAFIDGPNAPDNCDLVRHSRTYNGWAHAVNSLSLWVRSACNWIVTGGADNFPVENKVADEIAAECNAHFGGTFGVMQPAGDKWGALDGSQQPACTSPWLGAEWCRRMYGGNGPLWEGYPHYYADAELYDVAKMLGRLWWRDDLTQFHAHYLRRHEPTPEHLHKWQKTVPMSKALYLDRLSKNFPGHEPLYLDVSGQPRG